MERMVEREEYLSEVMDLSEVMEEIEAREQQEKREALQREHAAALLAALTAPVCDAHMRARRATASARQALAKRFAPAAAPPPPVPAPGRAATAPAPSAQRAYWPCAKEVDEMAKGADDNCDDAGSSSSRPKRERASEAAMPAAKRAMHAAAGGPGDMEVDEMAKVADDSEEPAPAPGAGGQSEPAARDALPLGSASDSDDDEDGVDKAKTNKQQQPDAAAEAVWADMKVPDGDDGKRNLNGATGGEAESLEGVRPAVRLLDPDESAAVRKSLEKTYRAADRVILEVDANARVSKGGFARVTDGKEFWWAHTDELDDDVQFLQVLLVLGFPVDEIAWLAFNYGDEGAADESERRDCHTAVAVAALLDSTLHEAHSAAGGQVKVAIPVMDSTSMVAKPDYVTENGIKGAWERSRKIVHDRVAAFVEGDGAVPKMSVFVFSKAFGDKLKADHPDIFGDGSSQWKDGSGILGSVGDDLKFYAGARSQRFSFRRRDSQVCVFKYHPSEVAPGAEVILTQLALGEAVGVRGELARLCELAPIREALKRACDAAAPSTLAALKSPKGRVAFKAKLIELSGSETIARVIVAALAARTRTAAIVYETVGRHVGGLEVLKDYLARRNISPAAAKALDEPLVNVLCPIFGADWAFPTAATVRNIMHRVAAGQLSVTSAVRRAVSYAASTDPFAADQPHVEATTVLYGVSEVMVHMHARAEVRDVTAPAATRPPEMPPAS